MQPLITMLRREFGENATVDLIWLSAHAGRLLVVWVNQHAIERGKGEVLEALKGMQYHHPLDMHGSVVQVVGQIDRRLDVWTNMVEPLVPDTRLAPRTCGAICGSMPDAVASTACQRPTHGEKRMGTMRLEGALPHALKGRKDRWCSLDIPTGQTPSNDVVEATIATAEDQK